jgi:hypothetical protein
MKTKLLLITLLSFSFYLLSSQIPQGFNYQAIARDATGTALPNLALPVRITIQSDSLGGTTFWIEEHSSVITNNLGLFTLIMGRGLRQTGSTASTFNAIDWTVTPKYIKTEINYNGWKNMGSTRLWSVPYAQVSGALKGSVKSLSVKGDIVPMDSALFEVKNNTGQTVFAVYNEGVRVYVDDGIAKGATKGGFAIGGFGTVKAPSQEFFRVTRDSTRVYVKQPVKGATKGGFAIGGFDGVKAMKSFYLNMTPQNYFIGDGSGENTTTGLYNSFMGYKAGNMNTSGSSNVFVGNNSGLQNTTGYSNVFIGDQSGYSNKGGWSNLFMGPNSGYLNTTGNYNVFMGDNSGYSNTTGIGNVFLGWKSGNKNVDGSANIFLGPLSGENNIGNYSTGEGCNNIFVGQGSGNQNSTGFMNIFIGYQSGTFNTTGKQNFFEGLQSGFHNTTGSYNTYLGHYSGYSNLAGSNNTYMGHFSGFSNVSGSGNIFIGTGAGSSELGSNKLYIDNMGTSSPLIGGDFAMDAVGINRMPAGIAALEVGGSIWANGATISQGATTWSDIRYKKDIVPLTNALSDVLKMQGVRYNWKQSEFPELNFSKGEQIGVIAQDMEKILPELVVTGTDGYKSVSYEKLTPVLIEAIKEQQKLIDSQKAELQSLKLEIEQIKTMLAKGGAK